MNERLEKQEFWGVEVMEKQWRCPQCETLNQGNFCGVCGFDRKLLNGKKDSGNDQSSQNQFSQDHYADFQQGRQYQSEQGETSESPSSSETAPTPAASTALISETSPVKKKKHLGWLGLVAVIAVIVCMFVPANDYQSVGTMLFEKGMEKRLMEQFKSLAEQEDVDGICELIDSDESFYGMVIYYIGGTMTVSKNENVKGRGIIYDRNGIYYGSISRGERNGSGKQYYHLKDTTDYKIADGSWAADTLDGSAVVWDFMEGGNSYKTKGFYADGYEDGPMKVYWTYKDRSYFGSYTASMGEYVDAEYDKNTDKYVYVTATVDDCKSWLKKDSKTGNGFFLED